MHNLCVYMDTFEFISGIIVAFAMHGEVVLVYRLECMYMHYRNEVYYMHVVPVKLNTVT